MDQTSKKEGHCDIIAHTVLLYVLFCLTYMHCTLYILHIVYISCFPVSDVEVSPSTSVHALVQTYTFKYSLTSVHILAFTSHHTVTKLLSLA